MTAGRPTKYREEFNDALDEYLKTTGKEQMSLPTIQGFALYLQVDDETLTEWSKVHKEFSATLKRLKHLQAKQLIDDGIYGGKEVNSTIVKLLLQNNHGMRERTETEVSGNGFMINVNTDAKSKLYGSGPVPTQTAGSVDNAL